MLINRLIGEIEDPYMDLYFLLKEDFSLRIFREVPIKMSNIDGMRIVPPSGQTYGTSDLLLKAIDVSLINKRYSFGMDRIKLFALSEYQAVLPIFGDDEIDFTISTKGSQVNYTGKANNILNTEPLTKIIENFRLEPQDYFKIEISLKKSNQLRNAFEEQCGTENYLESLKSTCLSTLDNLLKKYRYKGQKLTEEDLFVLKSLEIIKDNSTSKKDLLKELSDWINLDKIKSFSNHPNSISLYENILGLNTVKYQEILENI